MKQLDATELQEAANIMAALGPDALAIIQWLSTTDVKRATRMQILDAVAYTFTHPLDYRSINDNVRELERVGILHTYTTGVRDYSEEHMVALNPHIPWRAECILHALFPWFEAP